MSLKHLNNIQPTLKKGQPIFSADNNIITLLTVDIKYFKFENILNF